MKSAIPLSHLLRPVEPVSRQAAASKEKSTTVKAVANEDFHACDNRGLRRLDPSQVRNSVGRGEAEARLLFAKAQMPQRPLSSLLAQANVDSAAAVRLLD